MAKNAKNKKTSFFPALESWAKSLCVRVFCYVFVNMGMVCGLLPIVGVPLPLVSYGGTSIVSLMIGFGVIMSMRFHKAW